MYSLTGDGFNPLAHPIPAVAARVVLEVLRGLGVGLPDAHRHIVRARGELVNKRWTDGSEQLNKEDESADKDSRLSFPS